MRGSLLLKRAAIAMVVTATCPGPALAEPVTHDLWKWSPGNYNPGRD